MNECHIRIKTNKEQRSWPIIIAERKPVTEGRRNGEKKIKNASWNMTGNMPRLTEIYATEFPEHMKPETPEEKFDHIFDVDMGRNG